MFFSCRWDAVLQRRRRGARTPSPVILMRGAADTRPRERPSKSLAAGSLLPQMGVGPVVRNRGREDADDKQGYIDRFDTQERVAY